MKQKKVFILLIKHLLTYRASTNISVLYRFILLPTMVLWFTLQLIIFSIIGVILWLPSLFMIISNKSYGKQFGFFFIILPIISPFIWWYKYWAYGEYLLLFDPGEIF